MNKWPLMPLKSLIIEIKEKYRLKSTDKPVLSVTNSQGFVLSEEFFGHQIYSRDLRNYKVVKRGQFAYNPSRLNVGSVSRLTNIEEGLVSPLYIVFQTREDLLDPSYLMHWFASPEAQSQIILSTQGSVRDTVSFAALSNLLIPLPPLPVQRRIAEILGSVDAVINVSKAIMDRISQIYPPLLDRILTSFGTHISLKELIAEPLRNGYSAVPTKENMGVKVFTLSALTPYGLDPTCTKFVRDIPEVHQADLIKGDLLISRSNTRDRVGFVGLYNGVPQHCYYPDLMIRIRVNQNVVLPEFLELALQSSTIRTKIQEQASGTSASMVKINRQILHSIGIPLPNIEKQHAIVHNLNLLKRRLQSEVRSIALLHQLKTVLLRHLLFKQMTLHGQVL